MASLYDKLNRMQPIKPAERRSADDRDCLVVTKRFPIWEWGGGEVSADAMAFLSDRKINSEMLSGDYLFLDTETTGLSNGAGTLAFLIGLGRIDGKDLVITQILMRDYHQETLLLREFSRFLENAKCLVTFNGASFDIPLLQGRLTINRIGGELSLLPHLDLLHSARRVFKLRLGRCSLQRLEEQVFGEVRTDDLPGSEVPKRYFEYLASRDEGLLTDVLEHNLHDISSLARLLLVMAGMHREPLKAAHQEDLFSLGRVFERLDEGVRAAECYRAVGGNVGHIAKLRLAELYRKKRMDSEAAEVFEALKRSPGVNGRVFISLSKIYEHSFIQPERALEIARQGMIYCTERLSFSAAIEEEFKDLEHRCKRLSRKVEKIQHDIQRQIKGSQRAAQTPEWENPGS
jgi:uncharacterized protein YprB with RNaseH-like and TPR domain